MKEKDKSKKQMEMELRMLRRQVAEMKALKTDYLRTGEVLFRVNRAHKAISSCNRALLYAKKESDLLRDICQIIVEIGGYGFVWVGFIEHDGKKSIRPMAQAGYEDGFLSKVNHSWADNGAASGPTGEAIRTGRTCMEKNIQEEAADAPWRIEAAKRGYNSLIAIPFIADGEAFGVLNIYALEKDAFDMEEVKLLINLAENLSYGIMTLRARDEQRRVEGREHALNKLLTCLHRVQTKFIKAANPHVLYEGLLEGLLSLTQSEYGFIGEVLYNDQGKPYLKIHAFTNSSWNKETRKIYKEYASKGMNFYNLKTLFGAAMSTGKPVIANNPSTDPRRGGLPEGHPPLNKFLGLPIYAAGDLVGLAGIANRPAEYDEKLIRYLDPFLDTCGNIVAAYRNEQLRKRIDKTMQSIVKGTSKVTGEDFISNLVQQLATALGFRYAFVGELVLPERNSIKTLAVWADGKYVDNLTYALAGTPC